MHDQLEMWNFDSVFNPYRVRISKFDYDGTRWWKLNNKGRDNKGVVFLLIMVLTSLTVTLLYSSSWEESGYYDLTANIDYILNKTGHKKVAYVGHSQGTTEFFAMAAMRPEYNDKISVMIALAPVAYMGHMASPLLKLMAKYINIFEVHFILIKYYNFLTKLIFSLY